MNDEFMHQLYEEPHAEFREAVYQHISQQPQSLYARVLGQKLTLRSALIVFALVFLGAACVYAVTDRGWRNVGGIWVDVERTYKPEINLPPETSTEPSIQPQEPKCLTMEEAKKMLRFEVRVPTWAPQGFTLDDRMCGVDERSDFANLAWKGTGDQSFILLDTQNLKWFDISMQQYRLGPPYLMFPVAPGSYKEVRVHGQPAVLVRGDWDFPWLTGSTEEKTEFKWDKKGGLHLYWAEGETFYHLYTVEKVSVEDLIKMADSTQ